MRKYLIDSNIFINSNNRYKQKFFPVLWNFILDNKNILVMDKVYDELCELSDDLSDFMKNNYKNNTIDSSNSLLEYREVLELISNTNMWTPSGSQQWLESGKADPWLIACAKHNDYILITDEKNTGPNGRPTNNEPKIPFVSNRLNVRVMDFWDFLEDLDFVAN